MIIIYLQNPGMNTDCGVQAQESVRITHGASVYLEGAPTLFENLNLQIRKI